jgi:phosphoribosylanthranilate isomerase
MKGRADRFSAMSYRPLVKICGVRDADTLDQVIAAGADMVGFVHFPKSPRHLAVEAIGDLISLARGRIETVVLLVNPDNSCIAEIAALDPDWVQLHGTESVARAEALRAEAGIPVIKAIGIGGPEDLAQLAAYDAVADRLILDARPPKGADRPGGLGEVFDWSLLESLDPALPFMLSGGLNPDNVGDAISRIAPFGLDVSSGVERAPGIKDEALIRAFMANVQQAAAARG